MLELQKKVAQAIVNVFETGTALGRYGSVTLIPGDSGHLTYGRSQTTLASGNLAILIQAYCDRADAEWGSELRPYLGRLTHRDLSLDGDKNLKSLLRRAGDDPVMRVTQDTFFERLYWVPAQSRAVSDKIETALGTAVVYDSHVHGSWGRVRTLTGSSAAMLSEKPWISKYVSTRRDWLATHANAVLHRTVYRMNTFRALIDAANWNLELPITVTGVLIDELALTSERRGSAEDVEETSLSLESPPVTGERVERLQRALKEAGITIEIDGIFGPQTDAAVRLLQSHKSLAIDGVVGPATRAALGL
jgi:chitosanase